MTTNRTTLLPARSSQRVYLLTLLLAFALPKTSFAQVESSRSARQAATVFFFDAIAFISEEPKKSRLEVYIQVPHEELHFMKDGDLYAASYDATVQVMSKEQKLVDQRSWSTEVRVKEFNQTTSNKLSSLSHRVMDIPPGDYEILVDLLEPQTQKRTRQRKSILVIDFEKDTLALSDIMLVNRLTTVGDKKSIVPNIAGTIAHQTEGFFLFLEAYHVGGVDSLHLVSRIMDPAKNTVWEREQSEAPTESKLQLFIKVDSVTLVSGTYLVTVEAYSAKTGTTQGLRAVTSRTFVVRWSDLPFTITDLNKAIEQMRYVAKESELDSIRAGREPEEKRKRFVEFWKKRDPDASTPRNELMEEYYRRVDFANKSFTHYLEGWKTDMGMVYIRLGPPENVERHPFELNSRPYEIWSYYQLNRELVFIDYSGFGDYRLQNPTADLFRGLR